MTDLIKEVQKDNIEYINEQPIIENNTNKKSEIVVENKQENYSKSSGVSLLEIVFIMILMIGIISAVCIGFKTIKLKTNIDSAVTNNVNLYSALVQMKYDTSGYTLVNNNSKSLWGEKIESKIDKSGIISISYDKVPVEYCSSFIYKQKTVGWESISISNSKDKINIIDYKSKPDLEKACNEYGDKVYITFNGK